MRQAIHIFRKDVRHCWPYIAGVIAATAVHAWQESPEASNPPGQVDMSGVLLALLMALAWWLVIGNAVHGESLIGDRQFWTTRPYSWKSLLTAKLLFVAAFLMLPLLISDYAILLASGFNPLDLIPGLLWRQAWFLAFLALPFVLAALSRATREFVLAGIVFYVVTCLGLAALSIPAIGTWLTHLERPPRIWDFALWLMPVAGFSLVVWQYARRRTVLVRVFAIALGGLAPVVVWMSLARMNSFNPTAPQDDPRYRSVTLQLAADPGQANPVEVDSPTKGWATIPVKLNGWPRDLANCMVSGVATSAPGTVHARKESPGYILGTTTNATIRGCESLVFSIDDTKTQPAKNVDLWVTVFLKLYQRQATVDIQPEGGWTRVPGFGNVRWQENAHINGPYLIWRTALKPGTPGWAYSLSDGKSELVTDAEWPWLGNVWPASPAWFAMSPVYSYGAAGLTVVHAGSQAVAHAPAPRPLVLSVKRLVATLPRELKIPNVRLPK